MFDGNHENGARSNGGSATRAGKMTYIGRQFLLKMSASRANQLNGTSLILAASLKAQWRSIHQRGGFISGTVSNDNLPVSSFRQKHVPRLCRAGAARHWQAAPATCPAVARQWFRREGAEGAEGAAAMVEARRNARARCLMPWKSRAWRRISGHGKV